MSHHPRDSEDLPLPPMAHPTVAPGTGRHCQGINTRDIRRHRDMALRRPSNQDMELSHHRDTRRSRDTHRHKDIRHRLGTRVLRMGDMWHQVRRTWLRLTAVMLRLSNRLNHKASSVPSNFSLGTIIILQTRGLELACDSDNME